MAGLSGAGESVAERSGRFRSLERLSPLLAGLACAALLVALYAPLVPSGSALSWRDPATRGALIVAVLTGYAFTASALARRRSKRALEELRPLLGGTSAEHAARRAALESLFTWRRSWLPTSIGAALGLTIGVFGREGPVLGWDLLWWGPTLLVLFAQIGRGIFVAIALGRTFSQLGRRLQSVDLARVEAFVPFARQGAGMALLWIVGTSIASLLFIDAGAAPLIVIALVTILGVACAAVMLPLSGVRLSIRDAKERELALLRPAIERERARLLDGDAPPEGSRMAGLLAYRSAVESTREWPINATTVARLALYASVAIGSWLGGALVERVLEYLLP